METDIAITIAIVENTWPRRIAKALSGARCRIFSFVKRAQQIERLVNFVNLGDIGRSDEW
eukprot:5272844-Pleurochrysis_carterae.AAC.1